MFVNGFSIRVSVDVDGGVMFGNVYNLNIGFNLGAVRLGGLALRMFANDDGESIVGRFLSVQLRVNGG